MQIFCGNCSLLSGAGAKRSPHSNLNLTSSRPLIFGGQARGYVEYYECKSCRNKWERQMTLEDKDRKWSLA